MAIRAKNDRFIEELIQDDRYEITQDARVYRNGKEIGFTKESEERKRGKKYRYISYKGKDLKVHRIIYRKFKGPLERNKVIHHADNDTMNNLPDNLEQVTQKQNMEYKTMVTALDDLPF